MNFFFCQSIDESLGTKNKKRNTTDVFWIACTIQVLRSHVDTFTRVYVTYIDIKNTKFIRTVCINKNKKNKKANIRDRQLTYKKRII